MDDRDGASLDPELLQLQEVSSVALKDYPHVAEHLFQQWLVMPETVRLVNFLFFNEIVYFVHYVRNYWMLIRNDGVL